MLKFHPLTVTDRRPVADDAIALTFAVPAALAAQFRHRAGQHVALRAVLDGQEERRTYSIVSAEGAPSLTIAFRVLPGGRMSQHLARARPGDTLEAMPPGGSFQARPEPQRARRCAAFAAGCGITPVLSIAASLLERETDCRFQLYYGNTSAARTMLLDEVLALKNRFLPRFSACFVMSREPQDVALFNGRIDGARLREFARLDLDVPGTDEFFICGPGTMAGELQSALADLGATGRVHVEHFASGAPARAQPAAAVAAAPAAAADRVSVTVVMDGRRRGFTMDRGAGVILEAAERAGLDLPFSCRAGVCSTCRARLVSGSAAMEHNVALEDWEVEAGYILCCQARPTSAALEISYDE
ncbi:MAG: 2Fe-2S iron-sulfur cluster binding domain-containing protein [Steroidobacteraceae bacterium]|nr:2Fe-2S iron-sulfur cluster binding domain-containing protein [Steroidobacteraceae bacterium]